jgi:hypothetical protein
MGDAYNAYGILHDATTTVSEGNVLNVEGLSSATMQIGGTSTNFTVQFETSISGLLWSPYCGTCNTDMITLLSTTSKTGESWDFEIENYRYLRANITDINDGNITVEAYARR